MLEGGYHLIVDLEECDPKALNSRDAMLKLCHGVADILGSRVLKSAAHKFEPSGVTAFVLIAESHISVHTWPDSKKAFFDVFTCKEDVDVDRILDFILGDVGGKRGRASLLLRDSLLSRLVFSNRIPLMSLELDLGRPIYSVRSPYQQIELTKGPMGLSLFLDGYWQFVEQYEHIYHETLIHPALACAPQLRRIGIGGGGDGLGLREVLRYPQLGRVWMCELDPEVLKLASRHPEMVRLNRGAFRHPKALVEARDARQMLNPGAGFDVLVFDFPSLSDGHKYDQLYSASMYQQARRALRPGGVLVTQITDFPWNLRRTAGHLRRVFRHVRPIETKVGDSVFSFILASDNVLKQRRKLPSGLRYLRQSMLPKLLSGESGPIGILPQRRRRAA